MRSPPLGDHGGVARPRGRDFHGVGGAASTPPAASPREHPRAAVGDPLAVALDVAHDGQRPADIARATTATSNRRATPTGETSARESSGASCAGVMRPGELVAPAGVTEFGGERAVRLGPDRRPRSRAACRAAALSPARRREQTRNVVKRSSCMRVLGRPRSPLSGAGAKRSRSTPDRAQRTLRRAERSGLTTGCRLSAITRSARAAQKPRTLALIALRRR